MRALVPTERKDQLVRLDDVPEPTPTGDQVVIEVESFSLNRGETYLLEAPRAGWRPGQDVAGRIARTTDGGPSVGSRVLALADAEGWAERVAVPLAQVTPIPDALSTATAAALPLAGVTALRLIRAAGSLIGTRVLLTGAAGGVGHLLTELIAAAGGEVTAVTSSPERGARLLELGAAATVRSVHAADGRFDVVLDSVGGDSLAAAIGKARAETGLVLWLGQASKQCAELDFFAYIGGATGVRIVPFSYYRTAHARPDDLATLVRLVEQGRLHVEIGRQESWQQTAAVLADLTDRRIRGKAVLDVD